MRDFTHQAVNLYLSCVRQYLIITELDNTSLRTNQIQHEYAGASCPRASSYAVFLQLVDAKKQRWHGCPLFQITRTADVATTSYIQQAEQHDTFA